MFKIGINSAPRIAPAEVTETQESPVQQNLEQQSIPQAKPISAANTSIRAEAMFSEFAMRSQLTQQLARNESMNNPTSLKHIEPVELQAPLTQAEAEQQIENQPTYIKPFDADEASKKEFFGRTLNTGDDDDKVYIYKGNDGLVHVDVNGKEAWSGTQKQFSTWTIDTGRGHDVVINSVDGAKIETGDGNDTVKTSNTSGVQISTGDGIDSVSDIDGRRNYIDTGSENDAVSLLGTYGTEVSTGGGDDNVKVWNSDNNKINTGSGKDEVYLGDYPTKSYANGNEVNTGDGDDLVTIDEGSKNRVSTENGNDSVNLHSGTKDNEVDMGQGDQDSVLDFGYQNRVDGEEIQRKSSWE